jgi:hypothetical protein
VLFPFHFLRVDGKGVVCPLNSALFQTIGRAELKNELADDEKGSEGVGSVGCRVISTCFSNRLQ